MKYIILLLFFSLISHAEELSKAQFNGLGKISREPDFIAVNITVTSECYETPEEAQENTDTAVLKISNFLKEQKDLNLEQLIINGGYTTSYSRWQKNKEICLNTFQKTTNISLEIKATADFAKNYALIQSFALKMFKKEPSLKEQSPITFVSLRQPKPKLTDEHQKELMGKARNMAYINAKNNFKEAIQSCNNPKWTVLNIRELNAITPRAMHFSQVSKQQESSIVAPIMFDRIYVEANLELTFGFDGSKCYEP